MDEKKLYGIFRIEKVKLSSTSALIGRAKHAFREFQNDSFDEARTINNYNIGANSSKELLELYKKRIAEITTKSYKPPKNAVGIYEIVLTTTAGAIPTHRQKEFIDDCHTHLCRIFEKENVLCGCIHQDETTIHTHFFVTPIHATTKTLRRTRAEKENGTCRTVTEPILNATYWTGSPLLMSQLQDSMYDGIFHKYGLERGEVVSKKERVAKKKNVRSSLLKKQEELDKRERKVKATEEIAKRHARNIENDIEKAAKKAVDFYNNAVHTDDYEQGNLDKLPEPIRNESAIMYSFRVKAIWDAFVTKTKNIIQKLEQKLENANSILYKCFSIKKNGKVLHFNKGLCDAFLSNFDKLNKWENRSEDELISLGNNYKKYHANNYHEYENAKQQNKYENEYNWSTSASSGRSR